MKTTSFLIFLMFKVTLSCDDPNTIHFLSPFNKRTNIVSKMNEDLNIVCCHPDGADKLSWQNKLKQEIVHKSSNGVFSLKDDKNRLILRIDNITENKTGEYTCIHSVRGLTKSIMISTGLSYTPETIQKNILYATDKPIQLKCPLNENQGFNMWLFNQNDKNKTVVKPGKYGFYSVSPDKTLFTFNNNDTKSPIKMVLCQFQEVDSNGNVKSGSYQFTWRGYDPINVNVSASPPGPVVEGSDIKIMCTYINKGDIVPSFPHNFIMKKNMQLDHRPAEGKIILLIKEVTKENDDDYKCSVTKFLEMTEMVIVEEAASIRLNVIVKPKIISNDFVKSPIKLNEDVSLECQIRGKQLQKDGVYFEHFLRDSSQWVRIRGNIDKYDVSIKVGETTLLNLIIKKLSLGDVGKYRCVAKNDAGEVNKVGLLKIIKTPELLSKPSSIYIAAKPVKIDCIFSSSTINLSEDTVELQVLSDQSPLTIHFINKTLDEFDGESMYYTYEVVSRGELSENAVHKLQCYYRNIRTGLKIVKAFELKVGSKPDIPNVNVVCSGSSGIVFRCGLPSTGDVVNKFVKYVVSVARTEQFYKIAKKQSIVIPIEKEESAASLVYVVKDLIASTNYTFKWEGFNAYGFGNEVVISYRTKNIMLQNKLEAVTFSPAENMIRVNITWKDDCPYIGSNDAIRDIAVTTIPIQENGEDDIMEWIETNFTLDVATSSAQFLMSLSKPQIDHQVTISLRRAQGSSESIIAIYKAGGILSWSLLQVALTLVTAVTLLRW